MIHIVLGTRAQVIKVIPIMHLLKSKGIDYNFIYFDQHKETIQEMLDDFGLKKPDFIVGESEKEIVNIIQLFIWSTKSTLYSMFKSDKLYRGDKDGIVIVHGDALPLFFGAISGKKQGLTVVAVEAGLRSYNFLKPFPEEIVRYVTAKLRLIDIHYCQDEQSFINAQKYRGEKIRSNGNTILDSLSLVSKIERNLPDIIKPNGKFALVTIHRTENLTNKERFEYIIQKLEELSGTIQLLMIMHPVTQQKLKSTGYYERLSKSENIKLIPRLSFFNFNKLFTKCEFIISDGGSNQEESSYLGVPCLLFRSETERAEGLGENVVLSKFDDEVIESFISNYKDYRRKPKMKNNTPTEIIVEDILKRLH